MIKLSQRLSKLEEVKEKLKNIKIDIIQNNNGNSPEIEKHRNELFEKSNSRGGVVNMWNKGDINWEKVIPAYKFSDKKEAIEWFKNKIEGLK